MKIYTKLIFLFAVLIFIDQITKHFSNNPICNRNIAWNIPIALAIFYLTWIIIVAVLIYFFFKIHSYSQQVFIAVVLSGAFSNLIDRIRMGCVIDYIDLKFWPVFNLADVYITLGVILVLLNIIRNKNTKY